MIIKSPVGNLEICDNGNAITSVSITDKAVNSEKNSPLQTECACQLNEYFSGERLSFDLPTEPCGTDFQKSVWNTLLTIPFSGTMTYGEVATAVGKPNGARAVGGACNKNPILIIIPCHRVIGANGKLVGFGAGIERKAQLLDFEKTRGI